MLWMALDGLESGLRSTWSLSSYLGNGYSRTCFYGVMSHFLRISKVLWRVQVVARFHGVKSLFLADSTQLRVDGDDRRLRA